VAVYNVYEHEILGTRIVRKGISYGALLSSFVLPQIWMAYRKLWTYFWIYNIIYILYVVFSAKLDAIIFGSIPWESAIPPFNVNVIAIITIAIIVSPIVYGNNWWADSLSKTNYKLVDTIEAGSLSDATKIASFNKENNKRKAKKSDDDSIEWGDYLGLGILFWVGIVIALNVFS